MPYLKAMILSLALLMTASPLQAQPPSPAEIEARVEAAIELRKRSGSFRKTCAALSDPQGPFMIDEAYVFVSSAKGGLLCHPRPDLIERDNDGLSHVPEMIRRAHEAAPEGAWIDYLWPRAETDGAASKSTYCKLYGRLIFCAGAHYENYS